MVILLFSLVLPAAHLFLIGLTLKRCGNKISSKIADAYAALTLELLILLLAYAFPLPDGGIFLYFIIANIIGIGALVLQTRYYSTSNREEQASKNWAMFFWGLSIAVGLIFWIVFYIKAYFLHVS